MIEQNQKEGFLTALAKLIKKDPHKVNKNSANKLEVHKKTVGTAIKD